MRGILGNYLISRKDILNQQNANSNDITKRPMSSIDQEINSLRAHLNSNRFRESFFNISSS
jgi:hypothetical protein